MSEHDGKDHERDLLIARIIDGGADARDWERFRAEASRDASVWRELSVAQSDHEAMRESVRAAEAIARGVGLPNGARVPGSRPRRFEGATRWSGWGVAAALALVWGLGFAGGGGASTTGARQAGMFPAGSFTPLDQATPDEALRRYLDAGRADGRVVGEMPDPIVVETRPTGAGRFEVIYLRQIIERREIDRAYRRVLDEFGNPSVVPIELDSVAIDRAY